MNPMAAAGFNSIITSDSGGIHNITPPQLSDFSYVRRVRAEDDSPEDPDKGTGGDEPCVWKKDSSYNIYPPPLVTEHVPLRSKICF